MKNALMLIVLSIALLSCDSNPIAIAKDYRSKDVPDYTSGQILSFISQGGGSCDWEKTKVYVDGLYEVTGSATMVEAPEIEWRMVFKVNSKTNSVIDVEYHKYVGLYDRFSYIRPSYFEVLILYKEEQLPNYKGSKMFDKPNYDEFIREFGLPEKEKASPVQEKVKEKPAEPAEPYIPHIISPGPDEID